MQILFSPNRPVEEKSFPARARKRGGLHLTIRQTPRQVFAGKGMFVPGNTTYPSTSATEPAGCRKRPVPCTLILLAGRFDQSLLMMHSAPTGMHQDYPEVLTTNPPLPSRGGSQSAGGSMIGGSCESPGDGAKIPRAVKAPGMPCRKLPLSCGRMHARRLTAGGTRTPARRGG